MIVTKILFTFGKHSESFQCYYSNKEVTTKYAIFLCSYDAENFSAFVLSKNLYNSIYKIIHLRTVNLISSNRLEFLDIVITFYYAVMT